MFGKSSKCSGFSHQWLNFLIFPDDVEFLDIFRFLLAKDTLYGSSTTYISEDFLSFDTNKEQECNHSRVSLFGFEQLADTGKSVFLEDPVWTRRKHGASSVVCIYDTHTLSITVSHGWMYETTWDGDSETLREKKALLKSTRMEN